MSAAKPNKFSLVVDGKNYDIEVLSAQNGRLRLLVNGREHTVELAEAQHYGRQNRPPTYQPAEKAPPAPPAGAISAPMPGDIVEVYVQVGDRVEAGQAVCVLEAMKMKNVLRAAQLGVVTEVLTRPGQQVAYEEVLVKIAGRA
jgi:biotin carboxyl carrier protein